MKKLLLAILVCASPVFADIAVTPGSGKTVSTTTDGGLEYQNIVISTIMVNNAAGIPKSLGYTATSSSMPVAPAPGATWNMGGSTVTAIPPQGTNFPVQVNNSTMAAIGTLTDDGQAATTALLGVLPASAMTNYAGGTADVLGRNELLDVGTDGLLWTANLPTLRPASYSASTNTITVAATATDITALCGNASNMILVYGLRVSCTETTAGSVNLSIFKRSTKFTGAWSTMTAVSQDSTYAVTNSSAVWFTANPTVGTLVGHLDNYKLGCMATATASPNDIYISPANWRMKPIVLRGAAECITVNLESQTVTGGAFTVGYEWIETSTITQ